MKFCCIHLIYQYTHFFDMEVMYLQILFFKVLTNLSANIAYVCSHDFIDLL